MFLVKPTNIYAEDTAVEEIVNNKIDNMGRVNKLTEGVFTDIVGNDAEIDKTEQFINNGNDLVQCEDQEQYTMEYMEFITEQKSRMKLLASLEKLILQLRAKNNVNDIKLSILREYVYARCSFYRDDKVTKDIRVIVDKTEFCGDDVDKLINTPEFMDKAKEKLIKAMVDEIDMSVFEYERLKATI